MTSLLGTGELLTFFYSVGRVTVFKLSEYSSAQINKFIRSALKIHNSIPSRQAFLNRHELENKHYICKLSLKIGKIWNFFLTMSRFLKLHCMIQNDWAIQQAFWFK